jgi:hypothetical protein
MNEQLRSILIGTTGLNVGAVIALVLTFERWRLAPDRERLRAAVRAAAVTLAFQAVHVGEEFLAGFYTRFPDMLGQARWSPTFFVSLNLIAIAMWIVAIPALAARWRAALLPLWLLGVAGVLNGVGHVLLAIVAKGYFPGLVTGPLVAVAAAILLRRLFSVTALIE